MAQFQVLQPETTYTGSPIQPLAKGPAQDHPIALPRMHAADRCPDLRGRRQGGDGEALPRARRVSRHRLFRRQALPEDGGVDASATTAAWKTRPSPPPPRCPDDCGLCNLHTSHTGLANVDLTNRCNLTCPVCFANANAAGLPLRAGFRNRPQDAAGAARPAAGGRPHRAVFGRRAHHLSALPGRAAHGQGDGLLAHFRWPPTASSSPTWNSPSSARKPACTRSTFSSTASATMSTGARAARSLWEQKLQCIENVQQGRPEDRLRPHHRQGPERPPDRRHPAAGAGDTSIAPAASASSRWPSPAGSRATNWKPSASRSPISPTPCSSRPASPTRTRIGSRSPA